jgi:Serine/threonine protein kinase
MSDSVFSSFSPADQVPDSVQPSISETPNDEYQEENAQEEAIAFSKEYGNFKLLSASRFGLSRVFVANRDGHKVIVKALKKQFIDNPKYKAALKKEYELTSQLDHRFIRKALDYQTIAGLGDCIIMEYVEGKTLFEHVRVGTLTEKQIKNIFLEICDALIYMNQKQIVHCSLTTENILIAENDGHVKLIDVGIQETFCKSLNELPALELEYIAPEIIAGDEPDTRADIYSLGKIMELICNRDLSKQFVNISIHCIQFSKEQRFNNVSELKAAMNKGGSTIKMIIVILAICALGLAAYLLIPKIISESKSKTNLEDQQANFIKESELFHSELQNMAGKYKLTVLEDPFPAGWSEDSLRLYMQIQPYLYNDSVTQDVVGAIQAQGNDIRNQRQEAFSALLITEYQNAQDTLALRLKALDANPSDSMLRIHALNWFAKINKQKTVD